MNTSVLLITHDFGVVADFCESVAVAYAGEIIEKGSVDNIFNNAKHPYTLGLFASLPSLEENASRLKPIKGLMPDPTKIVKGCAFCEPGHFVKCIRAEVGANDPGA